VLLFLVRGEIPASHGMRHKLCADCGHDYPRNPDPQLFLRIDRNKSIIMSGKLAVGVARDSQFFFRAPICYRAHRAVLPAIAWHLVVSDMILMLIVVEVS